MLQNLSLRSITLWLSHLIVLKKRRHQAFLADISLRQLVDRQAEALNGMIVTDLENEDPDQFLQLDLSSERAHDIVARKVKVIRRQARYLKAKWLAEMRRKTSQSVRGILKDHPDIGEVMEKFVNERNIGADALRRTGVLTFDGNTRVKGKVAYKRIQQHLMTVYNSMWYNCATVRCSGSSKEVSSEIQGSGKDNVTES